MTAGPQQARDGSPTNVLKQGFFFKKRREKVDWRLFAAVNLDQVAREVDVMSLQELIDNLTFCDLEREGGATFFVRISSRRTDLRECDPNVLKMFKLAQFTIEYLLHSQV